MIAISKRHAAERAKRGLPPDLPTKRELASALRSLAIALDEDDDPAFSSLMGRLLAECFAAHASLTPTGRRTTGPQ